MSPYVEVYIIFLVLEEPTMTYHTNSSIVVITVNRGVITLQQILFRPITEDIGEIDAIPHPITPTGSSMDSNRSSCTCKNTYFEPTGTSLSILGKCT